MKHARQANIPTVVDGVLVDGFPLISFIVVITLF